MNGYLRARMLGSCTRLAVCATILGVGFGVWFGTSVVCAEEFGASPEAIQWLAWTDRAFERAEREDKLILLDLMAVWCHACHVMDETTYADPTVVRLVNEKFIAIRVDTDQRPDIDVRYRDGGWPTTSVLMPTGEILFQANALDPEELLEALRELDRVYRENKEDLHRHVADIWAQVRKARAPERYAGAIDATVIAQSMMIMAQSFDPLYGGFREKPKFFEPEAITLAFLLAYERRDPAFERMALLTLDNQLKLVDPVWGGFYRYAEARDWTRPHYEKVLNIQAMNLDNYLEAYQMTGASRYKAVAEGIVAYVLRFLWDHVHGGFYGSQGSDVRGFSGEPGAIHGNEYFALDDSGRRRIGLPSVDRRIYVGWNGQMAKSFLKAFQALGRRDVKDMALKTLDSVFARAYRPGRGLAHVVVDGEGREFGFLADQVLFGDALLAAYLTTGEPRYLRRAKTVADEFIRRLEDRAGGGFYDRSGSSRARGLLRLREKPLRVNLQAALLLSDLYYVTRKQAYRDRAERTLQFVLGAARPYPVAYTALAVHRFLNYPVHLVVVGRKTDPATTGLWRTAQRLYAPGKIVRLLDPDVDALEIGPISFPRVDAPRAYICTDRVCSPPLRHPDELEEALGEVTTVAFSAPLSNTLR